LVLKKINTEKEEMETRSGARNEIERTTSPEDTMELMSAVSYGLNLRPMSTMAMPSPTPQNNMAGNGRLGNVPTSGAPSKAVSAIKTNIKAATQVHPYQRN
jgi:mediator of RNA polymerase II transcription subunit 8